MDVNLLTDQLVKSICILQDSLLKVKCFTQRQRTCLGDDFFCALTGNVFVIAAILLERHLHSVANYLIVSLAVADLLVACLVMPLSAVYEVSVAMETYEMNEMQPVVSMSV